MTDAQQLAKVAFDAYSRDAEGVAANGQLIPEWDRVGPSVQSHWRAAVRAAFDRLGLSLADDVSRETSSEGDPDGA